MADDRKTAQAGTGPAAVASAAATTPRIRWDDSNLRSSYANVCNVSFTREEVVLMFGINQAWQVGQKEVPVQLTDRIILSPYSAKRLAELLGNSVREYESRFRALEGEARPRGEVSSK